MKFCLIVFSIFSCLVIYSQEPISNKIIHSTVKIDCEYEAKDSIPLGKGVRTGTAFFYDFVVDSVKILTLVTNKHVIKNSNFARIFFTEADKSGKPIYGKKVEVTFDNFEGRWIPHPNDSIDLCIMPLHQVLNGLNKKGLRIAIAPFEDDLIPTEEEWNSYFAIEDLYMVGYPKGLWDIKHNIPITRKGESATPLFLDFNGKQEFLVNIPIFQGSSGSPIMIIKEGFFSEGMDKLTQGSKVRLVGISYAGPFYKEKGKGEIVVDKIPIAFEAETNIPLNIAVAIKSSVLLEFNNELRKLIKN